MKNNPKPSKPLVAEDFITYLLYIFMNSCSPASAVTEALMAPAQHPDCSGTRNLHDNLSDLRAQVAANQRGSQLVGELIDSYGLAVVQAYMGYIQVPAKSKQNKTRKWAFVLPNCSNRVDVSEQRRVGGEGHAERLCASQTGADRVPGGGVGGFHGRRHADQTAGSD